jgi:hypothetical protein
MFSFFGQSYIIVDIIEAVIHYVNDVLFNEIPGVVAEDL